MQGRRPPRTDGRHTLRKIGSLDQADPDSISVALFRNARREPCGWFIGPLGFSEGRFALPYLPKTEETMASVAVVRALQTAKAAGLSVCLIDPEGLWDMVWHG